MKFDVVIHLASLIDFAVKSQKSLYETNMLAARNLISMLGSYGSKKVIFTSSNSIFLGNKKSFIESDEKPLPVDEYGRSKLDSENLFLACSGIDVNILRCPNIIDAGRVGMLSILFELIRNNSTLWVINGGGIRHQCLYAQDLNLAIEKLINYRGTTVHNIGSDRVPTFNEIFNDLIKTAHSKSKIRSIPGFLVIPLMKLLYKVGISPLGPYQFRMLTQNFIFDLSRIKKDLDWSPSKNNTEILEIAYNFYLKNYNDIIKNGSANSAPVNMGILSILKYIRF
jgi:nucleoside-diphosphate-sugar epimerase